MLLLRLATFSVAGVSLTGVAETSLFAVREGEGDCTVDFGWEDGNDGVEALVAL